MTFSQTLFSFFPAMPADSGDRRDPICVEALVSFRKSSHLEGLLSGGCLQQRLVSGSSPGRRPSRLGWSSVQPGAPALKLRMSPERTWAKALLGASSVGRRPRPPPGGVAPPRGAGGTAGPARQAPRRASRVRVPCRRRETCGPADGGVRRPAPNHRQLGMRKLFPARSRVASEGILIPPPATPPPATQEPRVATAMTWCSSHCSTGRASLSVPRAMTAIRSQMPKSSGR